MEAERSSAEPSLFDCRMPTDPPVETCCCTTCSSCGDVDVAVQLGLPPVETDSTLMDTPQILAATAIGIWALIGIFALSICRSRARLLRTLERLTFTREGIAPAMLDAPLATPLPAL
jgi:hypothetical protein